MRVLTEIHTLYNMLQYSKVGYTIFTSYNAISIKKSVDVLLVIVDPFLNY